MSLLLTLKIEFRELPNSFRLPRFGYGGKQITIYEEVEKTTRQIGLDKLQKVQLFDILKRKVRKR